MDSGIESVPKVDNADKRLVQSIKSLLCEIREPFPESGIRKISYTVYLTEPAPGWSHYLSLSASNFALIVMLPDIASLEGNKAILDTISEIQLTTNSSLKILGFLINKFDSRTTLSKRVIETTEKLASSVNSRLFENSIRQSVLLSENILEHEGIADYATKSLPAFLYSRFASKFLEAVENSATEHKNNVDTIRE